jgi:hypothetical protein
MTETDPPTRPSLPARGKLVRVCIVPAMTEGRADECAGRVGDDAFASRLGLSSLSVSMPAGARSKAS